MDAAEYRVTVTEEPQFLRIGVAGTYSRARTLSLLRRIRAEADARAAKRVLVDAREVPIALSTTDKFWIGVEAAVLFRGRVQVALLGPAAMIDGFGETVARNRGANVGVFTEATAAERWLTA